MKIFIIGSKHFYDKIESIKNQLEEYGHEITLPNSYDEPFKEEVKKEDNTGETHAKWKLEMLKKDEENIKPQDAIIVLNLDKGEQKNYIGGATFMEIIKAWEFGKKIFFYNPLPENNFTDELKGINPQILYKDLSIFEDKKVDVEIKAFIDENKYNELQGFFVENAHLKKEDYQETTYLDCTQDLRLEKNKNGCKVLLKKENPEEVKTDEEKIEIRTSEEGFKKFIDMFSYLGYKTEIKWIKDRKEFNWHGIKVILDNIQGYGYIIELEKTSKKSQKEFVLEELKQKLQELDIEPTPKEVFDQKFQEYKNNWQEILQEC